MEYFVKTFANLAEFSKYLNETPDNTDLFGPGPLASEIGTAKFTGTASFDAADDLLRYGDKKNAKRIKDVTAPADVQGIKDIKPRRICSYYGGAVNVAAALSGRPKTMFRTVREPAPSKVLNFCYNVSVSYKVSAAEIARTAAALVSAILAIERKGYRINLYAAKISVSTSGAECFGGFIKIKDSARHIDRVKMAYPLINPSMLRRHMFKLLEKSKDITALDWARNYGMSADSEKAAEAAKRAGLNLKKIVSYSTLMGMTETQIAKFLMQ